MSYAAGADVPLVLVNVVRGGPGLGSIAPSQSDYFQSTRGGGHGDYYCIVLAPKSVQECADLTYLAFDLADRYRMPVIVLADGMIGQMMEGVELPPQKSPEDLPRRDWTVGNMGGEGEGRDSRPQDPHGRETLRASRHLSSINLVPEELEAKTRARFERYEIIKKEEIRFEASGYRTGCGEFSGEGPDLTLVAYGTSARVCLGAKKLAEKEGIKLGLFRPITLWPFPYKALGKIAATGKPILTVEMSLGQLVEDVKLAVLEAPGLAAGPGPGLGPGSGSGLAAGPVLTRPAVHLLGHSGGVIPTEEEVFAEAKRILGVCCASR
jgi:2-oxoglutarate ferredoxin oxidoreductase subunit alpha